MASSASSTNNPALWILVTLLLCASACRAHQVENATPLSVYLKAPSDEPVPYRLQPGDQLEIRFHQLPEENVILPVRPDGFISLPMADEVRAAGRTPKELREELERLYSAELRSPRVAVIVKTFSAYKVHVGGHVAKPGVFDLEAGRTGLQAIFQAGGFLDSASPKHVVVMRRTGPNDVDVIQVDLEAALNGSDPRQDLMLQPFDLVFVPASPIANMNRWVDRYLYRNTPFRLNVGWRF